VVQYLALWHNSYAYLTIVVPCSRWSHAGLLIWHLWSQILKSCIFWKSKNASQNLAFPFLFFFSRKSLVLTTHCLSCISIPISSDKGLQYDHAGCKDYCQDFSVAQKCSIYLIRNKCMTLYLWGKKMLLQIGIALYRCFWWVLTSTFVWLCMFYG